MTSMMIQKDRTARTAVRTPARPARRATLFAAVAAVASVGMGGLGSTAASAAVSPWTPAAGSAASFDFAAGCNRTGAFGDPTVSGDRLLFFPANLAASTSPTGATSSDTLSAVLTAKPGLDLSTVSVRLIGDYSALRGGMVDLASFLRITPLDASGVAIGGTGLSEMVDFPSLPATTAGQFDGFASLALAPGVRSARVEVDADLFASAFDGGAAFIQLKGLTLDVDTTDSPAVVPLPAAALAAIPAGLVAFSASRRKRSA